jgi:thiaminase
MPTIPHIERYECRGMDAGTNRPPRSSTPWQGSRYGRRVPSDPAAELLGETKDQLADVEEAIRAHPFLDLLAAGEVPRERLQALAGEQRLIVSSDRRSFACLAARFPEPPAGDFFLSMAEGEGEALRRLATFAAFAGLDEARLAAHEPDPAAQSYPAFVAWLGLNGSRSDVVLAFLANLAAWGENCGRVAETLRSSYEASPDEVAFFEFFASPPPDFEQRALKVLAAGLDGGDSPTHARRATRLLQAYELRFWDAMASGL